MQTRIGHVHVRYRAPNERSTTALAVTVLDRVVRERIAAACDQAFSEVFEHDPAVYVLRSVTARVAVLASRLTLESRIAEQWGKRLCASAVRAVVAGEDGDNLVRFENQADFVARFLIDLIRDAAWAKWYYGAFHVYRSLAKREAILAVLKENRDCVWELVQRLRRANLLDDVLATLGQEGQRQLWSTCVRGEGHEELLETFRLFIASAFLVLDRLAWWNRPRPLEQDVLAAYVRTQPSAPQWTHRGSLAEAVADVVRYLARQGVVSLDRVMNEEQRAGLEHELTAHFDWLDTQRLAQLILLLVDSTASVQSHASLVRRPSGATPAQIRLLERLVRLLREGQCRLDLSDSAVHGNLLRLVAALGEDSASSTGTLAFGMVESIVEVWKVLEGMRDRANALAYLKQGVMHPLVDRAKAQNREVFARHLHKVAHAGDSALAVVEELLAQSGSVPDEGGVCYASRCAGLFLLVRAVQDIRLASVLKECGCDRMQPMLVGLAHRFGGSEVIANELFDPGAALWAGVEEEEAWATLHELESLDTDRFDRVLRHQLSAQRLIDLDEGSVVQGESTARPCSEPVKVLLDRTAAWTLRAWARWLPGLGGSSPSYLLRQFIRRPGTIRVAASSVHVHLDPAGLDEILLMAGYLSESPAASWLGNRTIRFTVGP